MVNINVGMGEIKLSKTPGTYLVAPGLGSCIGLIMYDPKISLAGMVHVVLPDSSATTKEIYSQGKYADLAIPELLKRMINEGANKNNLVVTMAGGAQMFTLEKGSNVLNIGMRNAVAVKAALNKEGLKISASDTGGNKGRTLKIEVSTGIVYVKSIGQAEVILGGNKCLKS
mgnify:CR=1 FL=1